MRMKTILVLFLTVGCYVVGWAQPSSNPIRMLRSQDDFSHLKHDSNKRGLDRLKYLPLAKETTISFGGEIREQVQYFDHLNFGDVPPGTPRVSVGQLWHRVMAHASLDIGENWRGFVQLNATLRLFNPNPLTPEIDENLFSLHQVFIERKIGTHGLLRLGKQELGYGNNRLLTFREGPNNRLAFNGVVYQFKNSRRKIDLLGISPAISKPGAFDDRSFREFVYGVYATEVWIPKKLILDYYILNFHSKTRRYNFIGGKETRQSYGLRLFSQQARLNYEWESTLQTGRFNGSSILAYALSADLNWVVLPRKKGLLGVSVNYISGDQDANDAQLNTYNLLFSKPSYGLAAPIGSSNIININPYLRIHPIERLSIYAGIYLMRRQSSQDGTYSPGMAQVRPTPSYLFVSKQTSIGTQYALETNYEFNHHIAVAADFAFFKPGSYVKETGRGLSIGYYAAKITYKF